MSAYLAARRSSFDMHPDKVIKLLWIMMYRWHNHLDPGIRKDAWTKEEEDILAKCHQVYGNKWAEIARFLSGRYLFGFCLDV